MQKLRTFELLSPDPSLNFDKSSAPMGMTGIPFPPPQKINGLHTCGLGTDDDMPTVSIISDLLC